jgi:arylsulfatase A-like enzyme
MVGELIAALESSGALSDTIVVLTSDHGEELLDHGGTGHGVTLYQEMIHVPLILRGPGIAAGARVAATVRHVDVLPTLLELVGVEVPGHVEGESLAAACAGRRIESRPVLAVAVPNDRAGGLRCAWIAGGWKLVATVGGSADAPADELYDLEADPREQDDRAAAERDVVRAMRRGLEAALDACGRRSAELGVADGDVEALTPELLEDLRELGYLGDG